MTLDSERDVSSHGEDHDNRDPNLPTLNVPLIKGAVVETNSDVVGEGHDPSGTNSIVCPDVRDDVDLATDWHSGPKKSSKQWSDGAFGQPVLDRVKYQFAAPVCVFLPTSQLVINCERDAFFEPVACPSCHAYYVAIDLEPQSNIEIFRDMRFAPVFFDTFFILESDLLECAPSQDGVVSYEGRNIARCHTKADSGVDQVGEKRYTVLEVVVGNLHDTTGELDNGNTGTLLHFGSSIEQAVFGHTGIGIDDEDIVSDTDISISPGTTFLSQNSFETAFIRNAFVKGRPVSGAINLLQGFFYIVGDCETVVHVGGLLEFSFSNEPINIVSRSSCPANLIIGIEFDASLALFGRDELETIVIDEDVCRAPLEFVCRDRLLYRSHSRNDNAVKTLFVDWALDRDMWQHIGAQAHRRGRGEIFRVLGEMLDWTDDLCNGTDNDRGEELRLANCRQYKV